VDVLARTLGQALAKTWGQQPVIDNRPGAGGVVASQALTQAAPDGYTLILVASGHPLNQFIYPSVPYDTFKDFTAITEVASSPLAIVVAKDSPYKTLGNLLAAAKNQPDKLSYGMSGNGTSAHLAGEQLKHMSGTKIVAKLETDLKAALQDPSGLSTLGKICAAPVGSSAKDFDAYMHAEATKWEPVLKAADIRAQ